MDGKITLITPPDIFENESCSVLFMHLSDQDQAVVSEWFAKSDITDHINVYFYDHEIDLPWLFHALGRCEYKFIDLSGLTDTSSMLSGYILGKKNTFYKTNDESQSAVYHYINQNRITNIQAFLEKAFDDKRTATRM
jgi:hypothetical protein